MATYRQENAAPLTVAVRTGLRTDRGKFIFQTNKFLSREVSKHSTIRLDNIEERLPLFTKRVQSLIIGLLDIEDVNGVDIGPQGVRAYSPPNTTVSRIHDKVVGELRKYLVCDDSFLKKTA